MRGSVGADMLVIHRAFLDASVEFVGLAQHVHHYISNRSRSVGFPGGGGGKNMPVVRAG